MSRPARERRAVDWSAAVIAALATVELIFPSPMLPMVSPKSASPMPSSLSASTPRLSNVKMINIAAELLATAIKSERRWIR